MTTHSIYDNQIVVILNIISFFVEGFVFLHFFGDVFTPKRRPPAFAEKLFAVLSYTALMALNDYLSGNEFYHFFAAMFLLQLVYTCIIYKEKILLKITFCGIQTLLLLSLETMVVSLQFSLNGQEIPLFRGNPFSFELTLFLVRRFLMKPVLLLVSRYLIRDLQKTRFVSSAYWYNLLVLFIMQTIAFDYQRRVVMSGLKIPVWMNLGVALIWILLPCIFCHFMGLLLDKTEDKNLEITQNFQDQLQRQFAIQVNELTENCRQFRHDFSSHLFYMDGLIQAGEYDKLQDYLQEMHQMDPLGNSLVNYTLNRDLNVLLNQEKKMADKYRIDFQISVMLPDSGHVRSADLNALVVNLCNNAIEAAAPLENAFVRVDIRKVKAYLRIEVKNSAKGDILKENPELLTGKRDKELHGMGIKIVKKIVNKYNGIYEVDSQMNEFTTTVLLIDETAG